MNDYVTRSPRPIIYLVSFVVAAIPFAFGAIRAVQTSGADLRYLWMAFAAEVAGSALMAIGRSRGRSRSTSLLFGACVVAALAAGLAGYLQHARSAVGILIVSIAFAVCWGASYLLLVRSRPADFGTTT